MKSDAQRIAESKKSELAHLRYNAKKTLMIQKAVKQGISVSESEVDAYIKSKG